MPPQMPPRPPRPQTDGIPKPKSLGEVLPYLKKRIFGFFKRLFYIISLVWEAAPFVLVAMMLFCVLDGVLPVLGAYISKDLLNKVAELIGTASLGSVYENLFVTLKPLVFLFVMLFLYNFLKKVLTRFNTTMTSIAGEMVVNHIKMKIMTKAKDTDLSSFDRPEFYEKLENANREAGMRPIHILSSTFNVISAFISAISFVVVLATLSPWAPVIIVVAAVPGAYVNYFYRNKNFHYIRRHSKERREMNYYSGLMVNKDMVKEIKLLGLGDTFIGRYKTVFGKYYSGLKRLILREGVVQLLVGLLSTLINCGIFLYVAYNVIFDNGLIGDYSLYTGALTSISGYVTTLLTSTASIYEGTLFINNMMDFMEEEVRIVSALPEPPKVQKGINHIIRFENVSFAYPGKSRLVLKNLNLEFKNDDSVVLVGLNGAGKTTLIKLLTRLYDPTEGRITLDGRDIREYDVSSLYDIFGIIFQDFGKYAESAADNIAFGDVSVEKTDSAVAIAAKQGGADGFIAKLPRGYDTPLTRLFEDDGIELSGGQWQKLSVARAFYKDSDILILDEPTAALDAIAEREVFDRFTELAKDKLTVFVSHRLSSAVGANKIVVLDDGELAEIGSHEELMAKRGKYFRLFSTQAERYRD